MNTQKSILLVEDEAHIAFALRENLEAEGYGVDWCDNGEAAIKALGEKHYDLLLLDVMLPEYDGYQICKHFREKDNLTPIIFVSARNDSESRLHGLRAGADDYITKPFDIDELLLKIQRMILKANPRAQHDIAYFGNCWIDFTTLEAKSADNRKIKMSKMEFALARLLITNENEVLSREYIYETLWGYDAADPPNSRTLDNFIVFLRKYFEPDPSKPHHFISVRGVGYKFKY